MKTKKQITKIVITGGPCAGKTTGMSKIQSAFTKKGYYLIFIPETATEFISAGINPKVLMSNASFQKFLLMLQLEKEKIFYDASLDIKDFDKILIVCDRGVIDNKAYMTEEEFSSCLTSLNLNEVEIRDNYDAVFHLVTAANGAEEFYTLENNAARTETIEQARVLDDKLISAWTGHPHFRVIDNSTDFDGKMEKLITEISTFLGEPEPYEIERKFLIRYPDLTYLTENPNCHKVEIIQTYLNSDDNTEVRIRQRGENGHYIYYKTTKKAVSDLKRIEIEERLSKNDYLSLLMDADTSKRQIRKDRYCLTYNNQYFEIDIYPFWKDKAIMEIELSDEDTEISFPYFIDVIKEVTDDASYKNSSLANNFSIFPKYAENNVQQKRVTIDTKTIIIHLCNEIEKKSLSSSRLRKFMIFLYNELSREKILDNFRIHFDVNDYAIEQSVLYNNDLFKMVIDDETIYLRKNPEELAEKYPIDERVKKIIRTFLVCD